MIRASQLTSAEDFAAEMRREVIRDSRWRRHRSMIISASVALVLVGAGDDLAVYLAVLLKTLA